MSLALDLSPVYKSFTIEVPEGEFEIEIRQATIGDNERRAELFKKTRRVWNDAMVGETALEQDINFVMLQRFEVASTLASCSATFKDGTPWFEFAERGGRRCIKDEAAFNAIWEKLPQHIARAIHRRVQEVNLDWTVGGGDSGE